MALRLDPVNARTGMLIAMAKGMVIGTRIDLKNRNIFCISGDQNTQQVELVAS
jgi:transketolase N-terminal domain/subunit